MRKSEYLHLHALFVELRRYLQKTGETPTGAFTAYDEYGVTPMGIHRRKERHHEALSRLRDGVHITIDARRQTVTEVTTDRTVDAGPLTR